MKSYQVNFTVVDDDMVGFGIEQGLGYFEPGWGTELMFHDIFEHWFEDTKFFKTAELSQAGECVALGIRSYLDNHTGLVSAFAGYNKFHGCEWNTWNTLIDQVGENLDPETTNQYPNDFNYTTLPSYKPENLFEGYVESYNKYYKIPKKLAKKVELAVSYGYWLGEQVHKGREMDIRDFMNNLKIVWEYLELDSKDLYEQSSMIPLGSTLTVNVGSKIVARLRTPEFNLTWSNETSEDYLIRKLEKINEIVYAFEY